MQLLYPAGKKALLDRQIDMLNDTISAALVNLAAYTYSPGHTSFADVQSAIVSSPQTLIGRTTTDGVFDAADATFPSVVGAAVGAVVIYQNTGVAATSRLIALLDGIVTVELAANAASGATSITIEDLPADIANGAVLTKVSGTGPNTITTSAVGAAGARQLAVAALTGALTAGAVYAYTAANNALPVTPNGGDILITWPAAGIFSI